MPLPRFRLAALFPPKYALSVFRQGLFFCDESYSLLRFLRNLCDPGSNRKYEIK